MKQIAKIEFIHLNRADYVIGMLKRVRDKAAKMYQAEDIQLLFRQTERNATAAIFYILEKARNED